MLNYSNNSIYDPGSAFMHFTQDADAAVLVSPTVCP